MSWSLFLNIVLAAAVIVLTIFISLVLFQLYKLIKELRQQIIPILSSLQTMAEEVNTELDRVDEIMKSAQEVSKKVDTTTQVAQELIASPLIRIAAMSAGIRKAISTFSKKG
ncbi:MAG TPA: DUF948 domain-containing protein [Candidatus Subteraquimicrobiales bacterium]